MVRKVVQTNLRLSAAERAELARRVRSASVGQGLVLRSRIVLACAEGHSNAEVARRLGVTAQTVGRWRARFLADRLAGLADRPRSGAPRSIDDVRVAEVVTATVTDLCPTGRHWSKRAMARHTGLSPTTVGRIWRSFGLKPYLFRPTPGLSGVDPLLGVVELAALHLDPPERLVGLCIGQAGPSPVDQAQPDQRTLDQIRATAMAMRSALEGRWPAGRARAARLTEFLAELHQRLPAGVGVHLVCDNHRIDDTVLLRRWQLAHPRFHLHFTPTSQFWANLVELKLVEMAIRQHQRGLPHLLPRLGQALGRHRTGAFGWLRDVDELTASLARGK